MGWLSDLSNDLSKLSVGATLLNKASNKGGAIGKGADFLGAQFALHNPWVTTGNDNFKRMLTNAADNSPSHLLAKKVLPEDLYNTWKAEGQSLLDGDINGFTSNWQDKWRQILGGQSNSEIAKNATLQGKINTMSGSLLNTYYGLDGGPTASVPATSVTDPINPGSLTGTTARTVGPTSRGWDSHLPTTPSATAPVTSTPNTAGAPMAARLATPIVDSISGTASVSPTQRTLAQGLIEGSARPTGGIKPSGTVAGVPGVSTSTSPLPSGAVEQQAITKGVPPIGWDAESALNNIALADMRYYADAYRPVNRATIASIGDNINERIAGAEVGNAGHDRIVGNADAMAKRNAARFGIARGVVDDVVARQEADLGFSKYRAGSLAEARKADYDRTQSLTDSMINLGRGLDAISTQNLTTAAKSESAVNQANANIDAQNDAAAAGTVATVASALIAAFA